MTDRLSDIAPLLEQAAPLTSALSRRVSALPALKQLAGRAFEDYGEAYCGGDIEASLRKVADRSRRGPGG